jgi:CubicO group peptidase (beta-lactamase class C family)
MNHSYTTANAIARPYVRRLHLALLLALLFSLMPIGAAQAERSTTTATGWWWFQGTTLSNLGAKVNQGYRITDLEIDSVSPFRVSATLVRNTGVYAKSWWWYYGVSPDFISQKLNEHQARIIDLETYVENGVRKYAVVMVKNTGADAKSWWWYYNLNSIQAVSDKLSQNQARLVDLNTFVSNGQRYYNVVMIKNSGADASGWWWYVNVSPDFISQKINEHGARLIDIERHGNGTFSVVMVKNTNTAWWWYYNISTVDQLKHLTVKHNARIIDIEPYEIAPGVKRYAVILLPNGAVPHYDIPVTGTAVPSLKAFDDAMVNFMQARNIPGGTLLVMKDGKVVLERGYGWKDKNETVAMPKNALMRLASVIKPFTAAAIRNLAAENQLNLNDRVFCLPGSPANCHLNLQPWPLAFAFDARLRDITIEHLLKHEGGWDRSVSGDLMFKADEIADDLNVASPPSKTQIARWALGKPLDFTPGSKSAYSNFGYMLLGLIIEQETGKTYTAHLQQAIMAPLGVASSEIRLGRTVAALAHSREPYYHTSKTGPSVYPPYGTVSCAYGCWDLESMEAHGGMIASGRAVAEFLQGYWISGQPRTGNGQNWAFFGALDGTWTMARQRADGVNIVALFNQRSDPSGLAYDSIQDILDDAADSITAWPGAAQPIVLPSITLNHQIGAPGSAFSFRMRGLDANEGYLLELRRNDRQQTLLRTINLNADADGAIDLILGTRDVEPGVLIALLLPAVQNVREAARVSDAEPALSPPNPETVAGEFALDENDHPQRLSDAPTDTGPTLAQSDGEVEPVAQVSFELNPNAPLHAPEPGFDAPLLEVIPPPEDSTFRIFLPLMQR